GGVTDSFTIMKQALAAVPAASGRGFSILEVSPRPSRGAVELSYSLPHAGRVKVAIYDAAGRRIATVADGEEPAGTRRTRWDGRASARSPIRAGVYFAVVDFGGDRRTARVVLAP